MVHRFALLMAAFVFSASVAPSSSASDVRPADLAYAHRSALLIKAHKPTASMLRRFCGLEQEALLSSYKMDWFVQYYQPDRQSEVLPFRTWCNGSLPVRTLRRSHLLSLFGERTGEVLHRKRFQLGSVHELAFHALHSRSLAYEWLWVIEQDVLWQGNLFEVLATFATWKEDYLCRGPYAATAEGPVGRPRSRENTFFGWHSGWAESLSTHLKCFIFVARYSRRMLDVLVEEYLKEGHWAQGEWFASTVCAYQQELKPSGRMRNCTVGDYMSEEYLFSRTCFDWRRKPRGMCPYLETPEGIVGVPTPWRHELNGTGQLFHPVRASCPRMLPLGLRLCSNSN